MSCTPREMVCWRSTDVMLERSIVLECFSKNDPRSVEERTISLSMLLKIVQLA